MKQEMSTDFIQMLLVVVLSMLIARSGKGSLILQSNVNAICWKKLASSLPKVCERLIGMIKVGLGIWRW